LENAETKTTTLPARVPAEHDSDSGFRRSPLLVPRALVPYAFAAMTFMATESRAGSYPDLDCPEDSSLSPHGYPAAAPDPVAAVFARLANEWREDRPWGADIGEISAHPAYLSIIGLGPEALPYILAELQRKVDHWFVALRAIAKHDPVPATSRGRPRDMAQAWIRWGRENGIIPG